MARTTTDPATLIRVPIADCPYIPIYLGSGLHEWFKANRVEVQPDYADRPSIDLPTAYRLKAEAEAFSEAEGKRRQAAAEKLTEDVDNAQRRRQEVYSKTYLANLPAGTGGNTLASTIALTEARQAAWIAVRAAEKHLPPEVAQQLGPVSLDGLPGNPGFHMMNITLLPPEQD